MAANTKPIFTKTVAYGQATVDTANTNRDGTGAIVSVITGGTDGTRITRITIKAQVTTTAGMVRLYIDDTTTVKLIKEVLVTAITASATVAAFESVLEFTGERAINLKSGHELQASTEKSEAINIIAEGGDYS